MFILLLFAFMGNCNFSCPSFVCTLLALACRQGYPGVINPIQCYFSLSPSFSMSIVQFSARTVQFSVRTVQFSARQVQFNVRTVIFSVRTGQFSVRTVQFSVRTVQFLQYHVIFLIKRLNCTVNITDGQ